MIRWALLVLFVLASLSTTGAMGIAFNADSGRSNGGARLYVDNSEGDSLTVIDVNSLKVIGDIKVGEHPHGITHSPDGRIVYVSIEGAGELVALDVASNKEIWRIPVGSRPNEISISGDGRQVFVPLLAEAMVAIVDTASRKVIDKVPVPEMPHNTYASADGRHIYVGSMSGQRITVLDAATHQMRDQIAPGNWVRPIAITRDESIAYTALSGLHGFAVVDLKQSRVIDRIRLPELPDGTPRPYLDTYTHGLALTPNERELYVTSLPGNAVYAFSLPELKLTAKIEVGKTPNWIVTDGRYVFVTNQLSNSVSVIETSSKRVVATIPVGQAPKRLAVVTVK